MAAAGRPSERIFKYRHEDFTKEFRRATRLLRLKDIVPYQCRHSGASLDKAGLHRTMLEIKNGEDGRTTALHDTKIWKTGRDPVRSQQKSTTLLQSHRRSSRAAYLWETPSRGCFATPSDGCRHFLNLFSNDRVGCAAQRLGVRADFWNLKFGEQMT